MSKNVALVLSSGGAKGYAHIGVIKVLEEMGYNITSVAGTSMGALVGGIYASGNIKEFENWLLSLNKKEILRLTDFSFSKKGIVKGRKVFNEIKKIVKDSNIEDLMIPYCAIATNILDGSEVIFDKGNLYDAIRSSVSIPIVFQPHVINNTCLVDGALVNPIPTNRIKRTKDDIIIAVDVNSKIYKLNEDSKLNIFIQDKQSAGIINLAEKSVNIVVRKLSEYSLKFNKPNILIEVPLGNYSSYDFYKAKEIIAEGEKAARQILKNQ